jgi:hypothetical protein
MFRKLLIPLLVLGLVFFTQCQKDELVSPGDSIQSTLKKGGKGGNGGNGGNGGSSGLYGDLVICLRSPDGIPIYYEIYNEEHNTTDYFAWPIKVAISDDVPLRTPDDVTYVTFDLNDEGEVIDDDPYYDVKEVEFGRLNIVRAPQSVLDNALNEAITSLTQTGITDITTDASGRLIAIIGNEDWMVNYDDDFTNDEINDKTIDSPRENMAIYQELLGNGLSGDLSFLSTYFTENDVLRLAYGAIAAGADKTGNMIVDEIAYMNDWLLKWDADNVDQALNSPDVKGRKYFDFSGFSYDRDAVYSNKYVRITNLNPNGTWDYEYLSLLNAVPWTTPNKRIQYNGGQNIDITGFSNAADDAIQVLEFIHESDLYEYSPYFTP